MKPGKDKIHKSCTIRCISGCIPPVFRNKTSDAAQPYQYYLMVNKNGKTINQDVLLCVVEYVSLNGKKYFFEFQSTLCRPKSLKNELSITDKLLRQARSATLIISALLISPSNHVRIL